MDRDVDFLRPTRGVNVDSSPIDPNLTIRKSELATRIRHSMDGRVTSVDATQMAEITVEMLADDDTRFANEPVKLRNHPTIFELELDNSFFRASDDGTMRPGEPVVMPLHATSVFFCAQHDRSEAWYCTAIVTCEDEQLLAGNPERPFFIWIG